MATRKRSADQTNDGDPQEALAEPVDDELLVTQVKARRKPGPKPGTRNPKSLENLSRAGRTPDYGVAKNRRTIRITDEAWEGIQALCEQLGGLSVSEAFEQVGRGKLLLSRQ